MKNMINIFIISSLLFFSCEKNDPSGDEKKERNLKGAGMDTLIINFDETIIDKDQTEWLKFNDLLEDSRCPVNVNCIWAGNAKIEFQYFDGFEQHNLILNTHNRYTKDTVVNDLYLELVDVMPYPHTDSTYEKESYRAKIVVSELTDIPGVVADVDVTLLDYTNLDGCGWVLEPEEGELLEPLNLQSNIDYYDGQRLRVTYIPVDDMASICMVGPIVKILKIEILSCNGYSFLTLDDDPFSLSHDRVEVNKAWFEADILNISVSYSGGCSQHDFSLKQRPFFCATPPLPDPEFFLYHDAHGDPCEAYITDTICFNMNKLASNYPEGTKISLFTPDKTFEKTVDFLP